MATPRRTVPWSIAARRPLRGSVSAAAGDNAEFKTWNRQLLLGVVPLAGKLPGAWARDEPGQIAIVKYLRQDLSELSAVIRRAKHHHPLDPRIDFPARLLGCRL